MRGGQGAVTGECSAALALSWFVTAVARVSWILFRCRWRVPIRRVVRRNFISNFEFVCVGSVFSTFQFISTHRLNLWYCVLVEFVEFPTSQSRRPQD